jgi:hypothetical protein
VLARKPGVLPGATALVQARGSGMFTAAHDAFWAAARKSAGDAGGTRALVEVLLLHRVISTRGLLSSGARIWSPSGAVGGVDRRVTIALVLLYTEFSLLR